LSKTDADIDLLADSILVFTSVNNIQPSDKDDYTRRFMELLYLLRKSDKIIEYYKKKVCILTFIVLDSLIFKSFHLGIFTIIC
jgi:hypothetical protein